MAGAAPPREVITTVYYGGRKFLRIEPPWISGYRPATTIREIT